MAATVEGQRCAIAMANALSAERIALTEALLPLEKAYRQACKDRDQYRQQRDELQARMRLYEQPATKGD